MDQILIQGLRVFAFHGVNPEEKRDGQYFVLDIILDVDLSRACHTDDIGDTVSYAKVIKTAVRTMQEKSYDLIERAAQRVAEQILQEYEPVRAVDIVLRKPDAPVKAEFKDVAVHILRKKGDTN